MRRLILLLVLATAAPGVTATPVYKCVHNGQTEYLQTRPREGQCDAIDARPPPLVGNGDSAAALQRQSKALDRQQDNQAERQQEVQQQAAERQYRCSAARRRQAMLDQFGSRQFSVDEQGNRQYMTDAQYQQERQAVEQALRENCG